MVNKRRSREELKEVDALVERLREFTRLNYVTAAEIAREIGVRDSTVCSWLLGQATPAEPKRITAFLDSLPTENGSGIAPTVTNIANTRLARYPKASPLPFLQAGEGRDSESAW